MTIFRREARNVESASATLIQALKSLENAFAVLNGAQTSVKDAGTALRDIETKVAPLIRDYKRFVFATFSTATQQLADFGLPPPKARKPMTSETRVVATGEVAGHAHGDAETTVITSAAQCVRATRIDTRRARESRWAVAR